VALLVQSSDRATTELWTTTPWDRFVDLERQLKSQPSGEAIEMVEHTHEWLCRQIVDNTGDAVIFGDAEGKVRLWNAGAQQIFGFSADEIVGKSMDLIIPENLRERHREGYDETMRSGRTQYSRNLLAVPALRKDGTRISIEFTIVLIRGEDGKLLGPAAVLRDVTTRWNRDKELRKRIAALEAEVAKLAGPAKSAS
jgi:PAS domain S-box-containing protein